MIPIRCLSCGKPVSAYFDEYNKRLAAGEKSKDILGSTIQWGKGTGENLQYLCVPVGAVGGVFGGAGYYVGMGVADLFKKGNDVNFAQGKNFAIMLTQPLDIPLH